jgi:DNA-binding LacI/PurR family transcriptional regulator
LEVAGMPADAIAYGAFTADGGAAAMSTLLNRWPDPDAVFVASNLMATGVLGVLRNAGRRVPDDVAVVGFNDSMLAAVTTPPLTTVGQDAGQPLEPGGTILPTELVVRRSA